MIRHIVRRLVFAAAGAAGILASSSFFQDSWAPLSLKLVMAAFGAATLLRPGASVLILAGLLPLSTAIAILWGHAFRGDAVAEVAVLMFLSGLCLRAAARGDPAPPPGWLSRAALLFALAVAASCVVVLIAREAAVSASLSFFSVGATLRDAVARYLADGVARPMAAQTDAAHLIEGIGLLAGVVGVCRSVPSVADGLPRMLAAGAAAAALLNVNRLIVAAAAGESPLTTFLRYTVTVRTNIHYGDVNAAGAYFLMMLGVATGVAFSCRRRLAALLWAVPSLSIAAGLWLTGSRSALFAGVGLACAIAIWEAIRRGPALVRSRAATLIGLAVLLAVAATILHPRTGITGNPSYTAAVQSRIVLLDAGLRMLATDWLFGAGIGRFYPESAQYIWREQPTRTTHAHAHNNYMQILAELGIVGFGLFAAVLVIPLRLAWHALRQHGADLMLAGTLVGLAGFLVVSFAMHPLLAPQVAYSFWMVLATVFCLSRRRLDQEEGQAPDVLARARSRGWRAAVALAASALVATVPVRAARAVAATNRTGASSGFSDWQTSEDGKRYRWAQTHSVFYVPADAGSVVLPLRARERYAGLTVEIILDGRRVDVAILPDDRWLNYRLLIPRSDSEAVSRRVELKVARPDPTAGAAAAGDVLMVGGVSVIGAP